MSLTKKRKASALEEDATPVKNGHQSPSADRGVKKEEGKKIPDDLYDMADTPFKVECPAHPHKRKSKVVDDVFGPEHEDGGFKNLDITYAVRPGSAWSALKPYRNFIGNWFLCPFFLATRQACLLTTCDFTQLASKNSLSDLLSTSIDILLRRLLRLQVLQKPLSSNMIVPTSG